MFVFSGKHKKQNGEYKPFTFLVYLETIPLVLGMLFNKDNGTHAIKYFLA